VLEKALIHHLGLVSVSALGFCGSTERIDDRDLNLVGFLQLLRPAHDFSVQCRSVSAQYPLIPLSFPFVQSIFHKCRLTKPGTEVVDFVFCTFIDSCEEY